MQTKSWSLQPQKNRLKPLINFAFKLTNKVIKFADRINCWSWKQLCRIGLFFFSFEGTNFVVEWLNAGFARGVHHDGKLTCKKYSFLTMMWPRHCARVTNWKLATILGHSCSVWPFFKIKNQLNLVILFGVWFLNRHAQYYTVNGYIFLREENSNMVTYE